MTYRVTLFPGDGIGPAVTEVACDAIAATGVQIDWDVQTAGLAAVAAGLPPLPAAALSSIRQTGVALKGPLATPAGRQGFRSVNVDLRREAGLYAQARPCRSRPGVPAVFPDVDVVVIRETTEDLYAGVEFRAGSDEASAVADLARAAGTDLLPREAGMSVKFTTERAARRVLEYAVDYARRHGRRRITVVHKATVMRATDGLFLEVARDVAAAAPELEWDEAQVDNVCGQLARHRGRYDVLVGGIQYGDVLSDLAAGLVGGIGVVPGVNAGDGVVMFEPAHGTMPRDDGRGIADPTAMVLCAVMLLDHLGETDAARRLDGALSRVLVAGECVTADLRAEGDPRPGAGTRAMGDAIVAETGRARSLRAVP